MTYNEVADQPTQGWRHANKLEMQKSSAKMLADRLSLRPKAIFDIFQTIDVSIQEYLHKLIPHRNLKQIGKTANVLMEAIIDNKPEVLKNYIEELDKTK